MDERIKAECDKILEIADYLHWHRAPTKEMDGIPRIPMAEAVRAAIDIYYSSRPLPE